MAEFVARIKPKQSTVAGETPNPSDLQVAELAVNTADGVLFTKHTDGTVKSISGGSGGGGGSAASIEGIGNVEQRKQTRTDILSWDDPFDTSATGGWNYDVSTSRLTLNKEAKNGTDIRLAVVDLPSTGQLYFSIDGTTSAAVYELVPYTNLAISGETVLVDLIVDIPQGEVPTSEIWISFDPVDENAPSQEGDVLLYDATAGKWEVTELTSQDLADHPDADLVDGLSLIWSEEEKAWVQGYPQLSAPSASGAISYVSKFGNALIGPTSWFSVAGVTPESGGWTILSIAGDDIGGLVAVPPSLVGVEYFGQAIPETVWISSNGAITWDADTATKQPIGAGDFKVDGAGQTFWLSLWSQDTALFNVYSKEVLGSFTIRGEFRIPYNGASGVPVEVTFSSSGGIKVAYGTNSGTAFNVGTTRQGIFLGDELSVPVEGFGLAARGSGEFYWEAVTLQAEGRILSDLGDVSEDAIAKTEGATLVLSRDGLYEQRPLKLYELGDVGAGANVGTSDSLKWNDYGSNGALSNTGSYYMPGNDNYFSFDGDVDGFNVYDQMALLQLGDDIEYEDEDGTKFTTTVAQAIAKNAGCCEWFIRNSQNWGADGLKRDGPIFVRSSRFDDGNYGSATNIQYTDRSLLIYDKAAGQWIEGAPQLSEIEGVDFDLVGYNWTISKNDSANPASGIVEVGNGWDLFFSGYSSDGTDHKDAFQTMEAGQAVTILVDGVVQAETTIEEIGNNEDSSFTGGQYRTSIRIPDADEGWMAATTDGQTLTALFPGFIEQTKEPENGASLIYDATASSWKPGSGSFSLSTSKVDPPLNIFNFKNSNQTPSQTGHWYWGYSSRGWIDVPLEDAEFNDDLIATLTSPFYLRKDKGQWVEVNLHPDGVVSGSGHRIYVDQTLPDTFMDDVEVIEIAQADPQSQPDRVVQNGDRLEYRDGAWVSVPSAPNSRYFSFSDLPDLQPSASVDFEFPQTGRAGQLTELFVSGGAMWVTIYSDPDSRALDVGRLQTEAPARGSGVLMEYVAASPTEVSNQVKITPAVGFFNAEFPTRPHLYARAVNIGSAAFELVGVALEVVKTEP